MALKLSRTATVVTSRVSASMMLTSSLPSLKVTALVKSLVVIATVGLMPTSTVRTSSCGTLIRDTVLRALLTTKT